MKSTKLATLVIIFVFAIATISCSRKIEGTFSGTFSYGFETSNFHADGHDEVWWISYDEDIFKEFVEDYGKKLDQLGEEYAVPVWYQITVKGTASKKGRHGHLGGFDRELKVSEFVSYKWIETAKL
ncbi:hypothetical protein [Pelagicoccus sp. SDUM812002]|uniref:hypothetical protein n=1 Tax=Pelagicoccus sp. SDUM812002 TaxID=3041266 RepID=UPI00280EF04F|nr:hypothetical protein [Pelagicoccus sp. SDUM812002]MDQ8188538.1 hypothetical protein [Pelagicoccus sp. SDUM812002]